MFKISFALTITISLLCLVMFPGYVNGNGAQPLAYWPFDGNAEDAVGDNDMTLTGGEFVAGKYGQALSLNGTGEHAVSSESPHYMSGLEGLTIAMWIKSNELLSDRAFMSGEGPVGGESGGIQVMDLRYDADRGGQPNAMKHKLYTTESGDDPWFATDGEVQSTDWQHITVTWDGSGPDGVKLYIDGVEDGLPAKQGGENWAGALREYDALKIGIGEKKKGWNGLIDDVIIYSVALSLEEIQEVMQGNITSVDARGKLATAWGQIKN